MDKDIDDLPLSQSNVSLRLSEIQQRCSELLESPDTLELTLEEPIEIEETGNPYDQG